MDALECEAVACRGKPEGGGEGLFAHFKEIAATSGFRSLQEGQRVQFEVKQGLKGPQASNIKPA